MDIPELIARINERHQTHFTLQHRYATGQNQGAYALTTPTGVAYVLKWNRRPPRLQSVRRAQRITAALADHHVPVPGYLLADTFDDGVTYYASSIT
jgi:hypothetical protein